MRLPQRNETWAGSVGSEIYHTGIYQSQNLTVEVWKAEWSDSISCIHLEYRNMENI